MKASDAIANLNHHFGVVGINGAARDWLLMLYQVIQFFDDVADRDEVSNKDLNTALWSTLVAMPANSFFHAHQSTLLPIVGQAILKWHAANSVERMGKPTAMSFAYRAGYYDIVLFVAMLIHGSDKAAEIASYVMGMYGEPYPEYLKEFHHA